MEAAKIPVAQVAPVEIGYGKPPQRPEGFASETAAITGKNKATINRAIRRANEVCQEARDLIRGTGLDTGAYLDRLALARTTWPIRLAVFLPYQNDEGPQKRA